MNKAIPKIKETAEEIREAQKRVASQKAKQITSIVSDS